MGPHSIGAAPPQDKPEGPNYVVLGWDAAAAETAAELLRTGSEIWVIAPECPEGLPSGCRWLQARAADPVALRQAGIESAGAVLVALPEPMARAAMAAVRDLRPGARLVASAQEAGSAGALRDCGALEAVDAREEAGREMVRLMLQLPAAAAGDET